MRLSYLLVPLVLIALVVAVLDALDLLDNAVGAACEELV